MTTAFILSVWVAIADHTAQERTVRAAGDTITMVVEGQTGRYQCAIEGLGVAEESEPTDKGCALHVRTQRGKAYRVIVGWTGPSSHEWMSLKVYNGEVK